jgi:hypothetical protein
LQWWPHKLCGYDKSTENERQNQTEPRAGQGKQSKFLVFSLPILQQQDPADAFGIEWWQVFWWGTQPFLQVSCYLVETNTKTKLGRGEKSPLFYDKRRELCV